MFLKHVLLFYLQLNCDLSIFPIYLNISRHRKFIEPAKICIETETRDEVEKLNGTQYESNAVHNSPPWW